MKIGSLVYATDQGLGILAKSFFDHGIVTDALVVKHAHHHTHEEWYPGAQIVPIRELYHPRNAGIVQEFCRSMDVMLFFETPFVWEMVNYCREHGVKTAIMPMHECMPKVIPHQPDLWLCPSQLDVHWASQHGTNAHKSLAFIPVPVEVPWRLRIKAETFVHNAGHGGLRGRNGTKELFEAMWYVRSPAKFIVRSQQSIDWTKMPYDGDRVELLIGTESYDRLWTEGDVFVFPEKFNGLSLPLQEARAAGMLVMGTDRFPMNEWLPTKVRLATKDEPMTDPGECIIDGGNPTRDDYREYRNPLIPVSSYQKSRIGGAYSEFDEATIDPKDIAAKIDEWYGRDISEYSKAGNAWAWTMAWNQLKPLYIKTLEELR